MWWLAFGILLALWGLSARPTEVRRQLPAVGERFRLWRGVATVLAVQGGEVKLRIEEDGRTLALLTIPSAAWAEVSVAWIALGAE